ncbi:hypothetical protein [Sphingomonas sp. GV3]|uniref:hypothetical protein n=1 Tax=Sphingomonas sp. GV3 TaxID=3040671 RepID=UPI00280A8A65|nr:hypothetical protein [Sphingomonas sp. GV3]
MIEQLATAPTSGSRAAKMGREARRLVLFDRAKDAVGGARRLGEIIDVCRRTVNHKLNAERRLTDWELKLTADAIEAKARELDQLAADIRQVLA